MPRYGGLLLSLFIFFMVGCSLTAQAEIKPTAFIPTSSPEIRDEWTELAPGLTMRKVRVEPPYASLSAFDMVVVRVDPALIDLRVHYEPTVLRTLSEWKDTLPNPLMIINGSFFTAEGYGVGLVVTDGQSYGRSLQGYGGMLQISGEEVQVRSLVEEPYQGEVYQQAAQGFPMFVQPGGNPARTGEGFDDSSRRTIVAQDTSGHILFMITQDGLMTLRNALNWLVQTEHFEIDVAFGLDGGKSTGMYLVGEFYPSVEPVPVVIAAYSR
ncbi:MAG: phosphodiester glycosidase family protein [Anaerolineae bacterium]|nr:phosphodiester glycosidase family protein [Anaerolineae bacterium]